MVTSEKIKNVVKKFERILPLIDDQDAVDMTETKVSVPMSKRRRGHYCGTVHCHAGWYALACEWDGGSPHLGDDPDHVVDYRHGVRLLKRDLGAAPDVWAEENPDIWGNDWGGEMFGSAVAFGGPDGDPTLTVRKIVDHWKGVAGRMEAVERGLEI